MSIKDIISISITPRTGPLRTPEIVYGVCVFGRTVKGEQGQGRWVKDADEFDSTFGIRPERMTRSVCHWLLNQGYFHVFVVPADSITDEVLDEVVAAYSAEGAKQTYPRYFNIVCALGTVEFGEYINQPQLIMCPQHHIDRVFPPPLAEIHFPLQKAEEVQA